MRTGEDSSEANLLLEEDELSSIDEDEFDHSAYVQTLEQVVHEAGPEWHIGLFGTWGSGKSSIISLLYDLIEEGKKDTTDDSAPNYDFSQTIAVRTNAWEHTGESIKTALLLDLNRELDRKIVADTSADSEEFGLLDSDEILHELYDVEEKEEREEKTFWEVVRDAPSRFIIPAMLAVVITLGSIFLAQLFPGIPITQVIMTLLGGGIFAYILQMFYSEYREEREVFQRRMVNPRNDWVGAYKDIYERILEEAKDEFKDTTGEELEHVVVTVDDLDRCESQKVYETLISMKSFMDQDLCTYIVPCDEDALYRHIRAADTGTYLNQKENQHNFLAKFFQTQLRIPELEMEQMKEFFETKNDALSEPLPKDIFEKVMTKSGVNTPRRVIQLLNRITTLKLLAEQRAELDAINTGNEEHMLFLAKVAILQEDYPEFYSALEQNEIALQTIYREWESGTAAQGQASVTDLFNDVGVPEDQHDKLITFLTGTRNIDQDPEPYLRLSGSQLSDLEQFENSLDQARVTDLQEMAREADEDVAKDYVKAIKTRLRDEEGRYQTLQLALQSLESFDTHQTTIAEALYEVLKEENHEILLAGVDLNLLRPCIERLSEDKQQLKVLRWYIETAISRDGVQDENLNSILQISPEELERLYEVRDTFAQQMAEALDAGTISKPRYDEIVDEICRGCPQLYTRNLVREGIV